METIETLAARVRGVEHGFMPMKVEAQGVVREYPAGESLQIARGLLGSPEHQARTVGTFVLGMLASGSDEALALMKEEVSSDPDWRVQEILAQAFDIYCADRGYEASLPTIREWLADGRANVRRAVTEGLRIWTSRPYFKEHPEVAVRMLGALHADESEYVRKSVGNALRDISRKHPAPVAREVQTWDLGDKKVRQTYKLAAKLLDT
jgi:hypothetical protein